MHRPDLSSRKSDAEPGQPAADISETFARTPVTSRRGSRENSRTYCEADSVGDPADYDGQESSASSDGQDVPESEGARQPRFLRYSRSFGDSETPPVAERSCSPVKSGLSTPAANLLSSLQRGLGSRLQGGKSRSGEGGCVGARRETLSHVAELLERVTRAMSNRTWCLPGMRSRLVPLLIPFRARKLLCATVPAPNRCIAKRHI